MRCLNSICDVREFSVRGKKGKGGEGNKGV